MRPVLPGLTSPAVNTITSVQTPGFTAAAIITLALGIGANATITFIPGAAEGSGVILDFFR
jgi:hypothetical protein